MFGSTILDVAAGIIFGFLAISLFTSASVEAINSALNVRVNNLRTGIMALVNDPNFTGLAKQLYQHALINPLGPGASDPTKNAPAYVEKLQFAEALLDITGLTAATPAAAAQAPGPEAVAALTARMATLNDQVAKISDPQIKQLLQGMIARCGGDMGRLKTDLANWFDNAMDRLSGEFKRRTQVMTFVIALVTALVINLDTIRVGTLLWGQTGLAEELKSITIPSSAPTDVNGVISTEKQVIELARQVGARRLPSGMVARALHGHRGQPGTLGSDLERASLDLVPPLARLAHHGGGGAVRRPVLVRRAPVNHPPQGRGPEPR